MANGLLIDARTFLGNVWKLSAPYWRSEEKWRAWGLLAAIVALSLSLVYMLVLLNDWNRQFYNALEQKDERDFFALLGYFCFLAGIFIAVSVYETYLEQMLQMRWRIWLTRQYLDDWLGKQVYYRLELEHHGTDNPDQRIQEDMRLFTAGTLTLGLGVMREIVTLASFAVILWNLSGSLPLRLGESEVTIPGYLVWVALVYAIVGSALTYWIGRPLIRLNFQQEQREADFRYALVRLRENAEGVALYRGEAAENRNFSGRIERIRENWWDLMRITKRVNTFTIGYNQVAIVFPFFVAGHRFFSGAIPLGGLTQIASAFGTVQSSLSWFVNTFQSLANWKASVDRLLTFHRALEQAKAGQARHDGLDVQRDGERTVRAEQLDLVLPNGRTILANTAFAIEPGERVVITGPSGSRQEHALPGARGHLAVRARARALPRQRARAVPAAEALHPDRQPARRRRLPGRRGRLRRRRDPRDAGRSRSAAAGRASRGRAELEPAALRRRAAAPCDRARAAAQARLAVPGRGDVRARRGGEQRLYDLVAHRLPDATLVSIAHRPAVAAYHGQALPPRSRRRADAAGDRAGLAGDQASATRRRNAPGSSA